MAGLDGAVVIVTGAAQGLGREHARCLAHQGARVVVNDVGVAHDGSGGDTSAAELAAEELRGLGGQAVANTDDVADWDGSRRLVEAAIAAFGRLDAVVNNAGIIRDRALVNMEEDDFDAVLRVHAKGTFCVTRWAARYWRDAQRSGSHVCARVVNTTSGAGLHGNFGQTNYAAAKAAIAAMTQTHAVELARYGVKVNAIAPVARTRMTDATPWLAELLDREASRRLDPAQVAPIVSYLASPACRFNGQVLSVCGRDVSLFAGWSLGPTVTTADVWTVDEFTVSALDLPGSAEVTTQHALLASG